MGAIDEVEAATDWRDTPITSARSIQTPYGEQDENGTDLSLIRSALHLSPLDRLRRADRARSDTLQLLEYGRRQRQREQTGTHR